MMLNQHFCPVSFPFNDTIYLSLAKSQLNVLQNRLIYSFKKISYRIRYCALLYNYYGVIYHEIYASEVYYGR